MVYDGEQTRPDGPSKKQQKTKLKKHSDQTDYKGVTYKTIRKTLKK
jgi:hypothetical protein